MPEGTRVHRCVEHIAEKQGGSKTDPVNAYAVCQKKTNQGYASGETLHPKKKKGNKSIMDGSTPKPQPKKSLVDGTKAQPRTNLTRTSRHGPYPESEYEGQRAGTRASQRPRGDRPKTQLNVNEYGTRAKPYTMPKPSINKSLEDGTKAQPRANQIQSSRNSTNAQIFNPGTGPVRIQRPSGIGPMQFGNDPQRPAKRKTQFKKSLTDGQIVKNLFNQSSSMLILCDKMLNQVGSSDIKSLLVDKMKELAKELDGLERLEKSLAYEVKAGFPTTEQYETAQPPNKPSRQPLQSTIPSQQQYATAGKPTVPARPGALKERNRMAARSRARDESNEFQNELSEAANNPGTTRDDVRKYRARSDNIIQHTRRAMAGE